jgi:tetratricopeptide (TPR) repeat protein
MIAGVPDLTPLRSSFTIALLSAAWLLFILPETGSALEYEQAYGSYRAAVAERDLDTALIYARRAHRLASEELGGSHEETGVLAYNLGALNYQLKRYRDSVSPLEQAVKIYRENHGKWAEKNLLPVRKLAMAQLALGNLPEAERHYVRTMEILEKHRGRNNPEIAEILLHLMPLARTLEEPKRVRTYGLRALHILGQTPTRKKLEVGEIHVNLAASAMMLGDAGEANRHLGWALEIFEAELPADDRELKEFYRFAAGAYEQLGRTKSARALRRKFQEFEP